MNKLLLIATFFLIGSTAQTFGQADYEFDDNEPNSGFSFRLGAKGGLNFADLNSDTETESKTGFHAGVFATFKFSQVAFQPEIVFSQQGGTFKFNGNDLESNYSYVNIPLIVKLYPFGGFNIQIGPQFGFLASAERDEFDQLTGSTSTRDVKDDIKNSEISLGLGAGWDLPFGFTISGRYNIGLTEINEGEPTWNAKNQVYQFSLGYRFIQAGR